MRQLTFRSIFTPSLIMLGAAGALAAAPAPAHAPESAPNARIVDGYIVTQRVSSGTSQPLTMRIKVAEGRIRVEMEGVPNMPPGIFMLARDDGKITMVMAQQGMAMVMDPADMANMGRQMMAAMGRGGAAAPPTISDVAVNVTDLGAGEKMLGYATRKYKVEQRHTSTAGGTATKSETVMELWMAADLPGLTDGLTKFAETFGRSMGGIGGGPDELKNAMTGKMPKGYPLKSLITSTTTVGTGQPRTDTGTLEVTEVTKSSFDAAEFEVPAGVQVMDMATMMRGRGGR